MRSFRTFAIVTAGSAALISAAAAEDFTFNVRVEVSSLASEINEIQISCHVCDARCLNFATGGGSTVMNSVGRGTATHTFPASGPRNFSGVIRVAFNANAGRAPESARAYQCDMHVPRPSGGTDAIYGPKPGAPLVERLAGSIGGFAAPEPAAPDPKGTLKGGAIPKGAPTLPK